jgi:enamine deaminase RidA (YjgF/YER057c/UK114 family)
MAARITAILSELGILLPALRRPGGNYLPARMVGSMVYLAGVISINAGQVITGTVGAGRHVRAAIGVPALQKNALVELQMKVEV